MYIISISMFLKIIGTLLVSIRITVILLSARMVDIYAAQHGKFRRTNQNFDGVLIVMEYERMFRGFGTGTKKQNLQLRGPGHGPVL